MRDAVLPIMETSSSSTTAPPSTSHSTSSTKVPNEKTDVDKPALTEAELILKGKKKVARHKYIMAAFIFSAK